jgi:hypothetical protein
MAAPSYCQIYCQKRGGEGIPGDGEFKNFSNLLISIYVYEGSNPTLSDTSFPSHFRYLTWYRTFLLPAYCQIPGTLGDESRSA